MSSLVIKTDGSASERKSVYRWLREFNEDHNSEFMSWKFGGGESQIFLVAMKEGVVAGGLEGTVSGKWLKIDLMAVSPKYRNHGIGTRLLESAIEIGEGQGCEFAYVDTMSYQAPSFYAKLGFEEVGRLINWDSHGHDKILMSKRITASPQDQ